MQCNVASVIIALHINAYRGHYMQSYTIRITLKANNIVKHTFVQQHNNTSLEKAIVAFNKLARKLHKQYASSNLTTSAYIFDANNNAVY